MTQACQNCKACGGEWIKRSEGKRATFWSSCRMKSPEVSSTYVGDSPKGGWMGVHPWVPYGYWCLSYVAGEDSTADHIVLGPALVVDKPLRRE